MLLWIVVIVQTVVIVLLAKLVAQFIQRFRTAAGKLEEGLNYGDRAPLFRAKDQRGEPVLLRESQGKPTLLFFGKQTCDTCHEIAPQLGQLQRKHGLRIIAITGQETAGTPLNIPDGIPLIRSDEIRENFKVSKMPTVVLVDSDGVVLFAESVTNLLQLGSMIDQGLKKTS